MGCTHDLSPSGMLPPQVAAGCLIQPGVDAAIALIFFGDPIHAHVYTDRRPRKRSVGPTELSCLSLRSLLERCLSLKDDVLAWLITFSGVLLPRGRSSRLGC